jgi:hypothetical protein
MITREQMEMMLVAEEIIRLKRLEASLAKIPKPKQQFIQPLQQPGDLTPEPAYTMLYKQINEDLYAIQDIGILRAKYVRIDPHDFPETEATINKRWNKTLDLIK